MQPRRLLSRLVRAAVLCAGFAAAAATAQDIQLGQVGELGHFAGGSGHRAGLRSPGSKAAAAGIAQTYPNPNGITLPLQRDFHAAMKAAYPEVESSTSFHLEGYLSARTVAEALKRSKEAQVTPASLERALRTGEMGFGGYRVDFTHGNVGSKWVDIGVTGGDGKLRY